MNQQGIETPIKKGAVKQSILERSEFDLSEIYYFYFYRNSVLVGVQG